MSDVGRRHDAAGGSLPEPPAPIFSALAGLPAVAGVGQPGGGRRGPGARRPGRAAAGARSGRPARAGPGAGGGGTAAAGSPVTVYTPGIGIVGTPGETAFMPRLSLAQVRTQIVACRACPRLVRWRERVARAKRA